MDKIAKAKILVTGGQGFIGSHFVDLLLKKGHEVIIFDRHLNVPVLHHTGPLDRKGVTLFLGDVKDPEALAEAVNQCDGVIHFAGLLGTAERITTTRESIEVNILGALNLYEAVARHNKPCVQITVGNYTWLNSYAITKYTAERFALMFNQERGTKIAVVRGLNVYGPRQKSMPIRKVVPNFILNALRNKPVQIYGDGEQLLDLIYVTDTVEILYRALTMNHQKFDGVLDAGSGVLITANYLAQQVIELSESKSSIEHLPMRPGEPKQSITKGNPDSLKSLSWSRELFTPLNVGLRETISWYRLHYNV